MPKRSLPYELVAQAVNMYGWPESTLFGTPLRRELAHAKRIIEQHGRRLFLDHYHNAKPALQRHMHEKACDDLIKIMEGMKSDKFYGKHFSTMTVLEKFIIRQERDGLRRKLKKGSVDDIIAQFK